MADGRYGGLRDEVPRGDVGWDVGGGEDRDLDLEEFDISPPRGVRREAAERSRRRRDEEAYMEGVRREHLGSAYMEEPRRSHADTGEGMELAAVGVRERGRWEPRSTSGPAFMVSKAADAAVWEDLKDIKPSMYDGNPLNLDRFLEKLDDGGVTVTEDMDPADAEKYVFRRFRYRLPEVLQELYFVATKEGKIKTPKEAKKWLNEQERVDALQVAAKRWKSIKLQHDGGRSAYGTGETSEGNTPSSAATWRTGTRVTSRLACSACCRKHGSRGSPSRKPRGPSPTTRSRSCSPKSIIRTWWLGRGRTWPGMSNGTPCGTLSSSPSRAIARRPRCGALTSGT